MSLWSRLTEKSWQQPGSAQTVPETDRPPAAKVLLILYFGVAAILFGLVSSAYLMRMGMPGMGAGQPAGPSLTKMKTLSASERNAKKAQRKRERDARKKGRK